jgi:DNA-binding MarR family transcriptional regulator
MCGVLGGLGPLSRVAGFDHAGSSIVTEGWDRDVLHGGGSFVGMVPADLACQGVLRQGREARRAGVFIWLASVQRLNFSTLSVLHSLSREGPRLTDLLATEQIKQPALTSLVSKLEGVGLVSRRPDPSDGRAALLSLTSAGGKVVQSRHADRVAKLARLIDRLDDHDRTMLADTTDVLSRLVAIAHDAPTEPPGGSQVRPRARRTT